MAVFDKDRLEHLVVFEDVEKYCGPVHKGTYMVFVNIEKISEEEAKRVIMADEYSPYVLCIPKKQALGLFGNVKVD